MQAVCGSGVLIVPPGHFSISMPSLTPATVHSTPRGVAIRSFMLTSNGRNAFSSTTSAGPFLPFLPPFLPPFAFAMARPMPLWLGSLHPACGRDQVGPDGTERSLNSELPYRYSRSVGNCIDTYGTVDYRRLSVLTVSRNYRTVARDTIHIATSTVCI